MIQIIIIAVYLLLTILIGIFSTKKNKQSSSVFNGTNLGLWMCVAVGAGEWLGGTSTSGVSEYGFNYGISGAWYTIANAIGVIFLAVFFAKLFRKIQTITVPGLMSSFIGEKTRIVASAMQIFILVVVGTSQLIAIGSIGQILFGLDAAASIAILGTIVLIYTTLGGMNAVGKTNMLHMFVMYGGAIAAVIICLTGLGGFKTLTTNLDSSYFDMGTIGFNKIFSWIIASVLGGCVAQAGLQPVLSAKNDKTAIGASWITAVIVAPFGLLTAILGIIARYKFPDLANGKLALPQLLMSLHPAVGGVLLASILAAILSTASPIFLSCGTIFVKDIYSRRKENAEDKKTLVVSRIATAIAGLITIGLAILLYNMQKVLDIVYFAYSLRGSMFVVLLLGILWKKVSPLIANIAMITTLGVGLFWVIWKQTTGFYPISNYITDTYASIIVALVITLVGSLIVNSLSKKTIRVANNQNDTDINGK